MNKCVGVKIVSWKDVPETVRILYKIPESGYVEKQFSESPDGALHIEYKWIGESIAEDLIKRLTKTRLESEIPVFDVEKELMDFIEEEKFKAGMGSGDDCYYAIQIEEYILSQKPFWCGAIKHFYEKGYKANTSKK